MVLLLRDEGGLGMLCCCDSRANEVTLVHEIRLNRVRSGRKRAHGNVKNRSCHNLKGIEGVAVCLC